MIDVENVTPAIGPSIYVYPFSLDAEVPVLAAHQTLQRDIGYVVEVESRFQNSSIYEGAGPEAPDTDHPPA